MENRVDIKDGLTKIQPSIYSILKNKDIEDSLPENHNWCSERKKA